LSDRVAPDAQSNIDRKSFQILTHSDRHYLSISFLVVVILLTLALLPGHLSESARDAYASESGPIQVLSAAGYLVVALMLVRELGSAPLMRNPYLVILPLAMCARELDFHVMFTTMSMTKTSFYVSGDVPIAEKLLAVILIGVVGWCVVAALRNAPALLSDLRAGRAHAIALLAALALIPASEMLDGVGGKLAAMGIALGEPALVAAESLEEVVELGIPVFLLVSVFAFFPRDEGRTVRARKR
jgi:hypothetical protein